MSYIIRHVQKCIGNTLSINNMIRVQKIESGKLRPLQYGDVGGIFSVERIGNAYIGLNRAVQTEPYAYAFSRPLREHEFHFHELISEDPNMINKICKETKLNTCSIFAHYFNFHDDGEQTWIPYLSGTDLGMIVLVSPPGEIRADTITPIFVPKGNMVTVLKDVWHCPPFVLNLSGINWDYSKIYNIQKKTHNCKGINLLEEQKYGICVNL